MEHFYIIANPKRDQELRLTKELCQFIQDCPTPFQFTEVASKLLIEAGYTKLKENDDWGENPPKKGFVIREKRALIAFNIGGYESGIWSHQL